MDAEQRDRITQVLQSLRDGETDNRRATDWLFTVLYGELRSIAERLMRGERAGHTLQPTAVVNEAYVKLAGSSELSWDNRAHFLAIAARAMRQVLIDYSRRYDASKRAGAPWAITITENIGESGSGGLNETELDLLALNDALHSLGETHERMGRVVELKMFAGMKEQEIAHVLAVSKRTVANDWKFAKLWLSRELGGSS